MHVVVADDDRDIRDLVGFALQRAGHRVSPVADGRAALEAVTSACPDALLLDVTMPEMSGLQVCEQLRKTQAYQGLPILIITANDDQTYTRQALAAGATGYVSKPFALADLVAQVEALAYH